MEKIWKNLTEGLKLYCKNNNFTDIVLGLSGGIDSAITSILAKDALGAEHVHALMMKTKHTSDLSLKIAAEIAKINQFDYQELNIEPLIEQQSSFLKKVFNENPKNIVL